MKIHPSFPRDDNKLNEHSHGFSLLGGGQGGSLKALVEYKSDIRRSASHNPTPYPSDRTNPGRTPPRDKGVGGVEQYTNRQHVDVGRTEEHKESQCDGPITTWFSLIRPR